MPGWSEYERRREADWSLLVLADKWNRTLWREVLDRLDKHVPAKHPETVRIIYPAGGGTELYLKMHDRVAGGAGLKDFFRDSKPFRALKISLALLREGFAAPLPVAAGERRRYGVLDRAFLLTMGIEGDSLPVFLRKHCSTPLPIERAKIKRMYLKQLAGELRRFHQLGFVHGDLVPTNIFVRKESGKLHFVYMDNDRTRRYPRRLWQNLGKRNLVQLNRFCLAGISLQDRMRFMHVYLAQEKWEEKDVRLLKWLERRTRRRREECDRIRASVTFRELMRWNGPFAGDASRK